ncbi:MAG: T9SS type A sorting domain-containing protein [Bacteroidota bacterium]
MKRRFTRILLRLATAAIYFLPLPALPSSTGPKPVLPEPPTLSIATVTGVLSGPVSVDVHAKDILNMGSFQFSIEFDTTLMTFNSVSNWYPGISDVLIGEFTNGRLAFIWAGLYSGVTITDNTFFTLNFTWLGSNSTSPLTWSDNPTQREFGDYDGNIFSPVYTNGSVTGYIPPPFQLDLQNITVGAGQTECYNALKTINVAGKGTFFMISDGGSATLISGKVILFMPGTTVDSGGYMNGHITTTGSYCGAKETAMTGTPLGGFEIITETTLPAASFKTYPNPTNGKFTLELLSGDVYQQAIICVYGPWGKPVITDKISSGSKKALSLEGKPSGLYFISVTQNDQTGTAKILLR